MNIVMLSSGYYPDPSIGRPISSGSIYVGLPDLDPEVVANQQQISVRQESGTVVQVSQPISTSAGGVPVYQGSPVTILVNANYSLKVLDSSGSQKYYIPLIEIDTNRGQYFYPDSDAADHGITGDSNTIKYYIDQIGTTNKATIFLRHDSGSEWTDYNFSTTEIGPSNINFELEFGARFKDDINNPSLTINGSIIANENQQIFNWGNGIGSLTGSSNIGIAYLKWWTDDAGDGSTDIGTEFQQAVTFVQGYAGELKLPVGISYSSTSTTISDRITLSGYGIGTTVLRPTDTLADFMIYVDDCWRNEAEGVATSTIDWDNVKSRVTLRDFTLSGDISSNNAAVGGITTKDRCDQLYMYDIDISAFLGTGLSLGDQSTAGGGNDKALIRESYFINVRIRNCGTVGTYPGGIISTGDDSADGTNNLAFINFQYVTNNAHFIIDGDSDAPTTRRISFISPMIHGRASWPIPGTAATPAADVFQIKGNVDDVTFIDARLNGSHRVSGTNYAALHILTNGTDAPVHIWFNGDIRTCSGDGIVVSDGGIMNFTGSIQAVSMAYNSFTVESGISNGIGFTMDAAGSPSYSIDSTKAHLVNSNIYIAGTDFPLRTDQIVLGSHATTNKITIDYGSGSPEGVVTSYPGALYLQYNINSTRRGTVLWVKMTGNGTNTNWQPIPHDINATTAQIEDITDVVNTDAWLGKKVYNTTTNKLVIKNGTGAAGDHWYDTAGVDTHTPV